MELFIRDFNLVTNNHTTSEPLCTKFAFSQSLTVCFILLYSTILPMLLPTLFDSTFIFIDKAHGP
jgi:hypothetical protein